MGKREILCSGLYFSNQYDKNFESSGERDYCALHSY